MKACILYHPQSSTTRIVEDYARDMERLKGRQLELLSLETREGAELATLYGVMQYPAVLTIRDNGELVQLWEGERLPLMDEVVAHLVQ